MNQHAQSALIFKAFSDEKRLAILSLLQEKETCACVLIEKTGIAQSALSYHMKILCDCNIVVGRQEGKWIHYSIHASGIEHAIAILKDFTKITSMANEDCCKD